MGEEHVPVRGKGSTRSARAETNLHSFLNKTEGPVLPRRQGETLFQPTLNGKGFYAV